MAIVVYIDMIYTGMLRPICSDSTTIIIGFLVTTFKVVNMESYV